MFKTTGVGYKIVQPKENRYTGKSASQKYPTGEEMAVPQLKWLAAGLSPQRLGFALNSVNGGFVVIVKIGNVSFQVLRLFLSQSFHFCSVFTHVSSGGWQVGRSDRDPVPQRHSLTASVQQTLEDVRHYYENWGNHVEIVQRSKFHVQHCDINPVTKETELFPEGDGKTHFWMRVEVFVSPKSNQSKKRKTCLSQNMITDMRF